jgi:hypothetical protein
MLTLSVMVAGIFLVLLLVIFMAILLIQFAQIYHLPTQKGLGHYFRQPRCSKAPGGLGNILF